MLFPLSIALLLSAVIGVSTHIPSDETLKLAFDRGQRFYVIDDFEQAIEKFEVVREAEASRFLNEANVIIQVGDFEFPVKVAAVFQLANSYRNLASSQLSQQRRERSEAKSLELGQQAEANFLKASHYFSEAAASTDLEEIKVLSQYQLLKTSFEIGDYHRAIDEATALLREFPESDYVDEALYEMGWAHYNLGQHREAVLAFERLSERSSADYRIDRAQFQIGRSYYEQQLYPQVREALGALIQRYDFSHLTEAERINMEAQKLSGVVKETALELVAKAELLIGDSYSAEGRVDDAAVAYRRVIANYQRERSLVERAYVKIGEAYFQRDQNAEGVQVYRQAIDEVSDRGFRARMQSRIARHHYESKDFAGALREYEIYLTAYADVGQESGLTADRAAFQVAQCQFELAEGARSAGDPNKAAGLYDRAEAAYNLVSVEYPTSDLSGESLFGRGLALQRRAQGADFEKALVLFGRVYQEYSDSEELASRALLQMARIRYTEKAYVEAVALDEEYLERFPQREETSQVLLELGLAYRDSKQNEPAVQALNRIPPNSVLWSKAGLLGGEILLVGGQLSEARILVGRGLAVARSKGVVAQLNYVNGKIAFEMGEIDSSVQAFTVSLTNTDDQAVRMGSLLGRGTALYKRPDYESAVRDLENLLDMDPSPAIKDQAHRLLGQCYVRLGRRAEAIEDYRAIIEASNDDVEKAEYTLLLGELFYSLERYDSAVEQCRIVLDSDHGGKETAEVGRFRARAYFVMADAQARQEKHEEARRLFAEALEKYPNSPLRPDLLFGNAVSAFVLEDYQTVVGLLVPFVSEFGENPNLENAHYFLAYSYLRQTSFQEAADWFGRLAEGYPQSDVAAECLFQRGESFFNMQNYAEAAVAYERILATYPESEFADDAMYNQGWCYFEMERVDEALQRFGKLLSRFPSSSYAPSAQFTLADYAFNEKDYDSAGAGYQAVIERYADSDLAAEARELLVELEEIRAYLRYEEAMALFDAEDYVKAAAALEQVTSAYPDTDTRAGALANLAMSYEFLHQWKDAARVYGELVDGYGEKPEGAGAVAFAREHLVWITTNRL